MNLFRQFIVRALQKEKVRCAVSILGIGLGVGVVLAIAMANHAATLGFAAALEALSGKAGLEIVASGWGLDERRLANLSWLLADAELGPIIEGDAVWIGPKGEHESLRVLGVDILQDRKFRDYNFVDLGIEKRNNPTQDFLRLLLDPESVIVTEKFAIRYGLAVGSSLSLTFGDQQREYAIRGMLRDEGPARAMEGNFLLMDIAAAQLAFDRIGRIDRLELIPKPRLSVRDLESGISGKLPSDWILQPPARRGEQVEKMLGAFHFNLEALSYISVLVGLFLIYNTVSTSVVSRRQEIGVLRAMGATRFQVLGLFLGEALAMATCGCVIGVLLSRPLAALAMRITGTTVKVLYIATIATLPPLSWRSVLLAFGMGIPLSLLAALIPAWEASRVSPLSAITGSDQLEMRFRLRSRHLLIPLVFFVVGMGLASLKPVGQIPIYGYGSAVALVFGAAFLTPLVLYLLTKIPALAFSQIVGVEGKLARSNLKAGIPRIAVSVAALSVSLSMMTAIATMIDSFRDTVIYWVGQTLQADLYIRPAGGSSTGSEFHLSSQLLAELRQNPAVAALDAYQGFSLSYAGHDIILGTRDFEALASRGNLLFKEATPGMRTLGNAVGQDAVMVSESFSLKFEKHAGDELTLQLPSGESKFRVAAVFFDYSNDRGTVLLDRRSFVSHIGEFRPFSVSLYLKPGVEAEEVRSQLLSSLGKQYQVFIHSNASLRREVLRIFDSTFAITYALEVISILVAILGVASTLLTLILERKKELALLRFVGAQIQQIKKMVLVEAFLLGVVSQAIGLLMGLALSWVLIHVINVQSFGWTIQFHFPLRFTLQSSLLVLAAALLAAYVPARRAAKVNLVSELAEE
ncbi:MAG: FtsX-like permease family protein [Terriglobia bacterium]